jgi:hypothetical protein
MSAAQMTRNRWQRTNRTQNQLPLQTNQANTPASTIHNHNVKKIKIT